MSSLLEVPASDDASVWSLVQFPSTGQRQEFLGQVRLWNLVEGLPQIETSLLGDGVGLCFHTDGPGVDNVLRLIDAFGGKVQGAA